MRKKYVFIIVILILIAGVGTYIKSGTVNKSYYIMKGSELETSVYFINGEENGAKIFIIGGIHGNEIAGIEAAEKIKKLNIKKGKIIVIPKCNIEACKNGERNPYYMQDLNRNFPGKDNGTDTERLAYEIYNLIKKEKPDIVIDLHEWESSSPAIIFNSTKNAFPLILTIIDKMNNDIIGVKNFSYYSTPPPGSINKEVSQRLNIPIITIESYMKEKLEDRINMHINIVNTVLKYYGMDE
ncbi:putative deacylase [Clostridium tetanomorphum]|uniref:Succinylglutamate desuccinylase/aspartoacylase family protein n=1 Tax=Clostridium tetanomorphum TaxID=1553 RepID=A0A923E8M2_CLOTT|nr:succinylglutamate desuccinylase/aspartoacylase family protein [Clostridium tetanomorphum]KAJ52090.1 succinylglutamate desuccinylase [Clostridium tetanomorphum DSM 665]MBC2397099.1 succinylglutamate desuccinylase/aspartoacylase family protein [Clostridium tetanomorphum]MBP1863010.1 putative deacylase [Clostridium tetanomorphum]NRS82839.1 putative deacylase [Clostridium tetanomorphum]NRZ99057.1 putative deacylase [Clostridium tetanomorphum]